MDGIVYVVFLIVIIMTSIVLVSDNLTDGILMIGVITNFLVIFYHLRHLWQEDINGFKGGAKKQAFEPERVIHPEIKSEPLEEYEISDEPDKVYGNRYKNWKLYNEYKPKDMKHFIGESVSELNTSIDSRNSTIAAKRARDKQCTDGWVSKNADYYKFHFAKELEESEQKIWWGNDEI